MFSANDKSVRQGLGITDTGEYNVFYDTPDGITHYVCLVNQTYLEACVSLAQLASRYMNPDGTGKMYPNGKGRYVFSNPRVERVGNGQTH